jgi:hypothetical protein
VHAAKHQVPLEPYKACFESEVQRKLEAKEARVRLRLKTSERVRVEADEDKSIREAGTAPLG